MQDAVERAARAAESRRREGQGARRCRRSSRGRAPRTASSQDYEAFRALAFEYDRHRDRLGAESCASSSTRPPRSHRRLRRCPPHRPPRTPGLRRSDGRRRRDPDAVGARRRSARLRSTGEPTFNRLWTLLGTPCVNVPGLIGPGRPAARRADRRALRARPVRALGRRIHRAGDQQRCPDDRAMAQSSPLLTLWPATYNFVFRAVIPVIPRLSDGLPKQLLWTIRSHRTDNFASKYQDLGNARLTIAEFRAHCISQCNIFVASDLPWRSVRL